MRKEIKMTNFEAAVELSLNDWTASFPTEFDLPEPSAAYQKGIAELMDKMRGDRYHKFTRRTARAILIAAIIMAIATVTLAATVGRDFIVQKFSDYSTYNVVDSSGVKDVEDIHIGYIPKGFELENIEKGEHYEYYNYKTEQKWINVYKSEIDSEVSFDTEAKNGVQIIIKNYKAMYYSNEETEFNGVVWNDGTFIYRVQGNIKKEELLRISENIS